MKSQSFPVLAQEPPRYVCTGYCRFTFFARDPVVFKKFFKAHVSTYDSLYFIDP